MQEMGVWYLDWEDTLEEEMTSHSSNLAWEIPLIEKPGGLVGVTKSWTQLSTHAHTQNDIGC